MTEEELINTAPITIVLTDEPPVYIFDKQWPIVSQVKQEAGSCHYELTVRAHFAQPDTYIVYARVFERHGKHSLVAAGGEVVRVGRALINNIRKIPETVHPRLAELVTPCIVGLPARELRN